MLNNILINKLNNRAVILNNPRPKTSRGTKKWCRKRGKALNNKHPALNNRLNNILNNTATGLFNALNNKLINGAPRLFNMKQLQGFVAHLTPGGALWFDNWDRAFSHANYNVHCPGSYQ